MVRNRPYRKLKASEQRDFHVVIEKGEDGYYIASVAELPGCHTQAKTLKELNVRLQKVIESHLEAEGEELEIGMFVTLRKAGV